MAERLRQLAGRLTPSGNRPTARETVSFATGYCVGYDETFAADDGTSGAYVCQLVIAADKLELTPGDPPFTVKGSTKGKPGLDRAEVAWQLKGQEEGLNKLSVADFLANRDHYAKLRNQKGDGRDPIGDAAQKVAREKAFALKVEDLQLADDQLFESEAFDLATQWMETQTALHDPDQIAGGHPHIITVMGDSRVNFSIGG